MENLNGKELIQELLYGISNKQLSQQIEYKNTLMAAQLAQDIALVILRYILSYSRTRKFKILHLFHPNLACIKREQWLTYVLFYNSSNSRPHFQCNIEHQFYPNLLT